LEKYPTLRDVTTALLPAPTATREAVEQAMESAHWDEENKTIELHDPDDPRMGKTVASRDELVGYLEDVASSAFYANCSRDEGEYISECDENDVVENVLDTYEERLTKFGSVAEFVGDKTQGGGLTAPQRGRRGHSQRLRQSGLGFPWVGVAKGGPGQNRTLCLPGPINPCPA
jgi:hypothetical protein